VSVIITFVCDGSVLAMKDLRKVKDKMVSDGLRSRP
jgi:hypothetical protein